MNGSGKSDDFVVPKKPTNKGAQPHMVGGVTAELVEGRGSTKGNVGSPTADETQCSKPASRGLPGIREAARRDRTQRFTALMHHVTPSLLVESFETLNPRASPGVDGVTWEAYGNTLAAKVMDLHTRLHNGRYRAQPSRRQYIPKPDGRKRPLGVAA